LGESLAVVENNSSVGSWLELELKIQYDISVRGLGPDVLVIHAKPESEAWRFERRVLKHGSHRVINEGPSVGRV
jgi:hypothetical protein